VPVFDNIARLAAAQHGLITHAQLVRAEVTPRQLRTFVAHGVLVRRIRGVYAVTSAPVGWEQELLACVLAAGDQAAASHRAAAALWRMHRFRGGHLDVTVPRWSRRAVAGSRIHESRALPTRDLSVVESIPVTSPTRTLIDMGRYVGATYLGSMMDDAVRRRLTSYEALHVRLDELATKGRDGIVTARTALSSRPGGDHPPDSELELRVRDALVRRGVPEPVMQHRIDCGEISFVVDFAWPAAMVALECDGFRFHRTPEQLEWDDRRRNLLGLRGWMLLHATWNRIRHDPDGLVQEVDDALGR
jgi:very-short-patch-repair endonuclease